MPLTDNTARSRFELHVDGHVAFADYVRKGEVLHIPHVEAPPALRGTGAAGKLMLLIAEFSRENSLKIHPICGYADAWLQKHPQHHDLRA